MLLGSGTMGRPASRPEEFAALAPVQRVPLGYPVEFRVAGPVVEFRKVFLVLLLCP
jgi:hypothetical protein